MLFDTDDIIIAKKEDPYEKSNHNSNTNNDRILCYTISYPGTGINFTNSTWKGCISNCCFADQTDTKKRINKNLCLNVPVIGADKIKTFFNPMKDSTCKEPISDSKKDKA